MKAVEVVPFEGQHCETTATGTLLNQIGLKLSEPMLFGLGEGLSFFYWKMKTMPHPFLGGRIKPDLLTANIARNLSLDLVVSETTSRNKAWNSVKKHIDSGRAVGLKLDCYHLDYFSEPIHFAGHYVALIGYDEEQAQVVDTTQQGGVVKTSLASLADARAEKGPMSSRNLHYTIATAKPIEDQTLHAAAIRAIRSNAAEYLNPPISNVSYRGIERTSREIITWFENSADRKGEFAQVAMLMERAGTGGSLFRNFYRDFLYETYDLTANPVIGDGAKQFAPIAEAWREVAELFEQTSATGAKKYVNQAAATLERIANEEHRAMSGLADI